MKRHLKIALALVALVGPALSGCVVYDGHPWHHHYGWR